jgi:hypothetical protein
MSQRRPKSAQRELLEGLDRALAFDRTADRARSLSPSLFPPEITCEKYIYDDGSCEHIYHHPALGELGRIRIEQRGGSTRISGLVAGDTEDQLYAQRNALFRPLMEELSRASNRRCFQEKHILCERCGNKAAGVLFIDKPEPGDGLDHRSSRGGRPGTGAPGRHPQSLAKTRAPPTVTPGGIQSAP